MATPTGLNFGQMQLRILRRIGGQAARDLALVATVKDLLNDSVRNLAIMRNWDWLESSTTLALTASTVGVALPSDCRAVFHVTLASTGRALPHRQDYHQEIIDTALYYGGRDITQCWDTRGGLFVPLPYPAGADTIYADYYLRVTDMVNDDDEPVTPIGYRIFHVEDVMTKVAATDSFDPSIAQRAWAGRNEALKSIMHTSPKSQPKVQAYRMLRPSIFGGGQFKVSR